MTDINRHACAWVVGDDTGNSSKTLWAVMMGVNRKRIDHPHDPADMLRCYRLLRAVPEWRSRLGEMATQSPEWAALVARWDEIEALVLKEFGGLDPKWNARSPRGYELMRKILDAVPQQARANA